MDHWKKRCILEIAAFKLFESCGKMFHEVPESVVVNLIRETDKQISENDFWDEWYDLVDMALEEEDNAPDDTDTS